MTATTGDPASSLEAISELLDLRPVAPGEPTPAGTNRLGLVSGRSGPRFLVPTDHRITAARSCLAYLGLRDPKTRLARGAVGVALAAGLGRWIAGDELVADAGPGSLLALLADLLEDPDEEPGLAVAVGMGHRDEVWKPTLQVFRPDGTPAAFVKVGLGPVAEHLVATEAATLAAWAAAADPRLVVPELIADTTWNGLRLAVVAPLPTDARRLPPGPVGAWGVRDLDGPLTWAIPVDAPWWRERRLRHADDPRIDRLLTAVEERWSASTARHGDDAASAWARWHGDWVPWNLARCHRGLVAWDWEYSEPGAPVGLDEVHGAYQQARVVEGRSIADALAVARGAAAAFGRAGTSPSSPQALRAGAGLPDRPPVHGPATWLADAHVAMLVTRSADLERRAGRPPADQVELLGAANRALGTRG